MFCLSAEYNNQPMFYTIAGSWVYSNYEIKEDGLRKHVAYTRSGSVGTFYVNGVAVKTVVGSAISDGGALII